MISRISSGITVEQRWLFKRGVVDVYLSSMSKVYNTFCVSTEAPVSITIGYCALNNDSFRGKYGLRL